MKHLKVVVLLLFLAAVVSPLMFSRSVEGQAATEAPTTDMDARTNDLSNGFDANFAADKATFEEREEIADGLGPVYNAQSCTECHQSPDTGAASQISEFRAGHNDAFGNFVDAPGGSLINDRAIASVIQERVSSNDPVRTFRMSLSTLGDGFVECVDSNVLIANVNAQPAGQRGTLISVPVNEANNATRTGRFGWKDQHASLISFSADAYLNEMGITSPLQPTENTSNGTSVAAFDGVADPEDPAVAGAPFGADIQAFTNFMRSLRAPGRGAITAQVQTGDSLFNQIGCNICHTRQFTTLAAGTSINQGAFIVPAALGNKIIHPFSDFALHDVGTGDGIVQNGGQGTRTQMRTAALWGVRARIRLMHDGSALTVNDAILAHFGQANPIINNYINLSTANKQAVIAFVLSL
ncbi:MAG TPA: di-heme oxidoredictase family protein [Blastocatellia bacterium]|nr:di-heme oxidoredictase family protein [Blastocatellia bacterium]